MRYVMTILGILVLISCKSTNVISPSKNNYPKMNLKDIHIEPKAVQTKLLLNAEEGKVVSLQILSGEQLKEHVSKVPAILICVTGKAIYKEESGETYLESGDYVMIEKDVKHEVTAITDSNFILVK